EEEEEDAFASVQVPAAAFLGSGTPSGGAGGSRGRLNSFTQGILPVSFSRPIPQGYCCLEQGGPGALELQRSRPIPQGYCCLEQGGPGALELQRSRAPRGPVGERGQATLTPKGARGDGDPDPELTPARSPRKRINGHKSDVKNYNIQKPVREHFNLFGRSITELKVATLQQNNFKNRLQRETAELELICKLDRLT
ncbi:CDK5 and ABL1 enzyme substrate 1, partial [Chelonia mydas]